VTSTIAFEGNGHWREYEGGVQDWLMQSRRSQAIQNSSNPATSGPTAAKTGGAAATPTSSPKRSTGAIKLSNREQREFDTLPTKIEALEQEQEKLRAELNDASLYSRNPQRATELHQRDAAIEEELLDLLMRWEALTARA
jgi:ATP-binding cassette subfamily F protein uup